MLVDTEVSSFWSALVADPGDRGALLILADWLEHRGDARGELLRLTRVLTQRAETPLRRAGEARLRQLIENGAAPCWPRAVNSIGMEFTWLPPGEFARGSPGWELGRRPHEPTRQLAWQTEPLWLATFQVTLADYRRVRGDASPRLTSCWNFADLPAADGWDADDDLRRPVECVSWRDAREFCQLLSALPAEVAAGRRYRLPTESEWEYACRAGSLAPFFWGQTLTARQANARDEWGWRPGRSRVFLDHAAPVGSYLPNAFGLYDCHGNVWELCGPLAAHADAPRQVAARGGSWLSRPSACRSAARLELGVDERHYGVGFRVALEVAAPR